LSRNSIEAVGGCCPLLESLECQLTFDKETDISNDEFLAIAKTMPQLRHLKISGNKLSSDGILIAILNGCPLLESLDLGLCLSLDWSESLRKRCYDQIKDCKLPIDYREFSQIFPRSGESKNQVKSNGQNFANTFAQFHEPFFPTIQYYPFLKFETVVAFGANINIWVKCEKMQPM
jgi:hypothetical protein